MAVQALLGGIRGVFTAPPANLVTPKFTSGALMGNGDIGVVAGAPSTTEQRFSFGKTDFWGTHWNRGHNAPEVSILSLGSLTLTSPEKAGDADSAYRVEQDILQAQVTTTLKLGGAVCIFARGRPTMKMSSSRKPPRTTPVCRCN